MLKKSYIGIDLNPDEMRAVVLQHVGRSVKLNSRSLLPLTSELFAFSRREPNILFPKRFVENLQELLLPMICREKHVALSLPDRVGRIFLTTVDTGFKSRSEGTEILKWKLKNYFPGPSRDVQLDYQVLGTNGRGQSRIMVAMVHGAVLKQYEDLIAEAGFKTAIVDFHSLNLYNFYRARQDMGEDFVLISLERDILIVQFFYDRQPHFSRVVRVDCGASRILHEVDRSLVRYRNHVGFHRAVIYLHCDGERCEEILEGLKSVFDQEVKVLHSHIDLMTGQGPDPNGRSLVAPIGAAERMI